jgi:hypothetical protein
MAANTFMSSTIALVGPLDVLSRLFGPTDTSTLDLPALLVLERILQNTPAKQAELGRLCIMATPSALLIECDLKLRRKSKASCKAGSHGANMSIPSLGLELSYALRLTPVETFTANPTLHFEWNGCRIDGASYDAQPDPD